MERTEVLRLPIAKSYLMFEHRPPVECYRTDSSRLLPLNSATTTPAHRTVTS